MASEDDDGNSGLHHGGDEVVQFLRAEKNTVESNRLYRKQLQQFAVCALNGYERVQFCTDMNTEDFLPFIPELVQCTLPIQVVVAEKDATADGVHHIIRVGKIQTKSKKQVDCDLYVINPLPQGHVALAKIPDLTSSVSPSTGPWKRDGPRRQPVTVEQLVLSLRQLSLRDVAANPQSQVVSMPRDLEGVNAGQVCTPPEEGANVEFKMTRTEIEHVLDALVADRLSFHGEPLLNAHGTPPTRLFIGVHEDAEKKGRFVGVCLSGTRDRLTDTTAWVQGLFPPLPSKSVQVFLHPVHIAFRDEDTRAPTQSIEWLPATTVIKRLVKLEGQAHVFRMARDVSSGVNKGANASPQPQVDENCYALARSEREFQELAQAGHVKLDRHVVEVQLHLSGSQVYFRTAHPKPPARGGNRQEDKDPYPARTSALFLPQLAMPLSELWSEVRKEQRTLPVLDGCGLWLRARFRGSTNVAAELCSDPSIVVLLESGDLAWDQKVLLAVCTMYDMRPSRLNMRCNLRTNSTSTLERMLHVRQRTRVFMILGLRQEDQGCLWEKLPVALQEELLRRAQTDAPVEFVAVLPAHASDNAAWALQYFGSAATPLADMIVLPFGDGVVRGTGVTKADPSQNSLELPHFRCMEQSNTHPVPAEGSFEHWLAAGGSSLTWPLVYHNAVPNLSLYNSLYKRVQSLLALSGKVHRHMLRKLHLACGATTTLRVLAWKLATQPAGAPLVLFAEPRKDQASADDLFDTGDDGDDIEPGRSDGQEVAAVSTDNEWIKEVLPQVMKAKEWQRNMVFLLDERSAITAATVYKLCNLVIQPRDTLAVVVIEVVGNCKRVADVSDTLVDPFLPRSDVRSVAHNLGHRFTNSTTALGDLIGHLTDPLPSASSSRKLDYHLFVLGLTARNGTFAPADKLAKSIVTEASNVQDADFPALGFVLTLSYLGAFAVRESDSQLPLQRTKVATSKVLEFVEQLPALQPLLVFDEAYELCRLCHPLLSRLVFMHAAQCEVQLTLKKSHIDRQFLASMHERVGDFIASQFTGKGATASRQARALDLLVKRHQGRWFSPLLAQYALDAPTPQQEAADLQGLRKLLSSPQWPIQQGYALLQESRVLRQWSTKASHSTESRLSKASHSTKGGRSKARHLTKGGVSLSQRALHDRLNELKTRAVRVAEAAHEQLRTFDSHCNLVSCLAHEMGKKPFQNKKEESDDDFKARRQLYLQRRQRVEQELGKLWKISGTQDHDQVTVTQLAVRHLGLVAPWAERFEQLGLEREISSQQDAEELVRHWHATGYWSFGHHFVEAAA